MASVLSRNASGTPETIAGTETGPLDPGDPDGWQNQFLTSDLDEYRLNYGGAGSCHIRETGTPQGFDLSGTMMAPAGTDSRFETASLQKGFVLSLAFERDGVDSSPGIM